MVERNDKEQGKIRLPILLFFLFSVGVGVIFLLMVIKKKGGHSPAIGTNLQAPPPVVSSVSPGQNMGQNVKSEDAKKEEVSESGKVSSAGAVLELTNLDYEIAKLEKQKKIEELKQELRALRGGGNIKGRGKEDTLSFSLAPPPPPPPPLPAVTQPPIQFGYEGQRKEIENLKKEQERRDLEVERDISLVVERIMCGEVCTAYVNVKGNIVRVKKGDSIGGFYVKDIKEDGIVIVGRGGTREVGVSYGLGSEDKRQDASGKSKQTVSSPQPQQFNRVIDVKR